MKRIILILAIIIASVSIASAQQYGEVIYLKNGSIIKGTIVEQTPNESYKIKTADGSLFVYKWSEVSKITKEVIKPTTTNSTRYQGEIQVGFGAGVGAFPADRVYLQTIQGVRVGDHFSVGLGIGLNIIVPYTFTYDLPELYMPIFVNVKGYLPINEQTSLFGSFDIGGSFGLTEGVAGFKGLMVCPSVGVSINNKVNLSLGYDFQKISTGVSYISASMNAVSIKVGYMF